MLCEGQTKILEPQENPAKSFPLSSASDPQTTENDDAADNQTSPFKYESIKLLKSIGISGDAAEKLEGQATELTSFAENMCESEDDDGYSDAESQSSLHSELDLPPRPDPPSSQIFQNTDAAIIRSLVNTMITKVSQTSEIFAPLHHAPVSQHPEIDDVCNLVHSEMEISTEEASPPQTPDIIVNNRAIIANFYNQKHLPKGAILVQALSNERKRSTSSEKSAQGLNLMKIGKIRKSSSTSLSPYKPLTDSFYKPPSSTRERASINGENGSAKRSNPRPPTSTSKSTSSLSFIERDIFQFAKSNSPSPVESKENSYSKPQLLAILGEKKRRIVEKNNFITEKNKQLELSEKRCQKLHKIIFDNKVALSEKNKVIMKQNRCLKEQEDREGDRDGFVKRLKEQLRGAENKLRSQDEIILDMNNTICEKSTTIVNQAKIIKNNEKCETVKLSEVLKKHEDQISTYRDKLKSLSQTIVEKEKDYAAQMGLIAAKVDTMTRNNDRIRGMSSENMMKDERISGLVKQNQEQGKELEVYRDEIRRLKEGEEKRFSARDEANAVLQTQLTQALDELQKLKAAVRATGPESSQDTVSDHRRKSEPIRAPSEPKSKTRSEKPDSESCKTRKSEIKTRSRVSSPAPSRNSSPAPDLETPKKARLSSPLLDPEILSDPESESEVAVVESTSVDASACVLKQGQYFVTNLPYMLEREVVVRPVQEDSVETPGWREISPLVLIHEEGLQGNDITEDDAEQCYLKRNTKCEAHEKRMQKYSNSLQRHQQLKDKANKKNLVKRKSPQRFSCNVPDHDMMIEKSEHLFVSAFRTPILAVKQTDFKLPWQDSIEGFLEAVKPSRPRKSCEGPRPSPHKNKESSENDDEKNKVSTAFPFVTTDVVRYEVQDTEDEVAANSSAEIGDNEVQDTVKTVGDEGVNCKSKEDPFTSSEEEMETAEVKRGGTNFRFTDLREGSLSPEYAPQTKSPFSKSQNSKKVSTPSKPPLISLKLRSPTVRPKEVPTPPKAPMITPEAPKEVPSPSTTGVPIVADPAPTIEQREGSMSPEYLPQTTPSKVPQEVVTPQPEFPTANPSDPTNDPEATKPDVQIVAYNDTIFIKSKKPSCSPQKPSSSPQKTSVSPQKLAAPSPPVITIESPSPSKSTERPTEDVNVKRGRGRPRKQSVSTDVDSVIVVPPIVPPKRGRGRPRKESVDEQPPIKITVTRNLWADWNPTQGKPSTTANNNPTQGKPSAPNTPAPSNESFLPPRTPNLPLQTSNITPPVTPDIISRTPDPPPGMTSEKSYTIINKDGSTKKRIRTVLKPQPLSRKLTALSRMQSPELIIKPSKSPNKIRKTGSLKQKFTKTISVLERVADRAETEERVRKTDERGYNRKTDERGYNRDSDYTPSSDESVDIIEID